MKTVHKFTIEIAIETDGPPTREQEELVRGRVARDLHHNPELEAAGVDVRAYRMITHGEEDLRSGCAFHKDIASADPEKMDVFEIIDDIIDG